MRLDELGYRGPKRCRAEETAHELTGQTWRVQYAVRPGLLERSKSLIADDALMQQVTLHSQPSPRLVDLKHLHAWLTDVWHGGSELRGPGSDIWSAAVDGRGNRSDLLSIWPRHRASDAFTMLFFKFSYLWTQLPARVPFLNIKVFPTTEGLAVLNTV